MSMYNTSWYDVIVIENGCRSIEFSTKYRGEAMDVAEKLHNKGKKVYINHNTVLNYYLTREIIDVWNNYTPYTVGGEE